MRKKVTVLLIIAVLTLAVTGCTGKQEKDKESSTTASTSATSMITESETKDDIGIDINVEETDVVENDVVENDDIETEENKDIETEENSRAKELGNIAIETVEWPAMMDITDAEMAESFLGINIEMCEDYYFANQLISAQLNEILIAKPIEGKEEDIKAAFDKHFEYIKNEAAFYPAQEESAAGAVMGETEDGYLYLIVHANGADVETALLNSN